MNGLVSKMKYSQKREEEEEGRRRRRENKEFGKSDWMKR